MHAFYSLVDFVRCVDSLLTLSNAFLHSVAIRDFLSSFFLLLCFICFKKLFSFFLRRIMSEYKLFILRKSLSMMLEWNLPTQKKNKYAKNQTNKCSCTHNAHAPMHNIEKRTSKIVCRSKCLASNLSFAFFSWLLIDRIQRGKNININQRKQ